MTNKQPYNDIPDLNINILGNYLNKGFRMGLPIYIPSCFKYLINLCWKQNPKERPSIDDIVNLFDAGILLPSIFKDPQQKVKYFEYLNNHLHLNIKDMNEKTLLDWHNRLIQNDKKELSLVIDFMLADFFKDTNSMTKLGYCYFNGILVQRNIEISIDYFKKASEKENAKSYFYLSEIYKQGISEIKLNVDLNESNRYLQLSADHGYQQAIDFLRK